MPWSCAAHGHLVGNGSSAPACNGPSPHDFHPAIGARDNENSHSSLRKSHNLPLLWRLSAWPCHGKVQSPQAHCPEHPGKGGLRSQKTDSRIHDCHGFHQHVGEQYSHGHHDAAHWHIRSLCRDPRPGEGRGKALWQCAHAGHCLCLKHRRHGHTDWDPPKRAPQGLSGREVRYCHRLWTVDDSGRSPGHRSHHHHLVVADKKGLQLRADQRA